MTAYSMTGEPATDPLLREIHEQPATLLAATDRLTAQIDELEAIRRCHRQASAMPVVLTGMGSSLDVCQAAASMLGRRGVPVITINTAELVNFRLPSLPAGALVIAVSQSGLSAEVVRLAEWHARDPAVRLVALTNGRDNPLARAASFALQMNAGPEEGPATKTFLASLVVLGVLVRVLTGQVPVSEEARAAMVRAERAAAGMSGILARADSIVEMIEAVISEVGHLVLMGRGVARASAEVGALVLKEASRTAAECQDAAEFRHGPLELAGPQLGAILVCLEPATLALDRRLLTDLSGRGTRTVAIGLPDPVPDVPRIGVEPVDLMLDAAVAAVPLQLLSWSRARTRSDTPGVFQVGSKVTTQE